MARRHPRAASPTVKLNQARQELVGRVTEALAGLTDIEPPGVARAERPAAAGRGHGAPAAVAGHRAWSSGCRRPGRTPAAFVEGLKGQSEQAVKVDLALRAVAAAEALEADDGDLAAEYERIAVQVRQKPNQVRKAYERNDLVPELAAQIRKSKALDWLLHHVEMVDPEGTPIDRDLVLGHTHDDDDDHDHDDHEHDHDRPSRRATKTPTTPRDSTEPPA